jgi:hypothetical protein
MRIKIPSLRKQDAQLEVLRDRLLRCPGVVETTAAAITGTILIIHEGDHDAVLAYAAQTGILAVETTDDRPLTVHGEIRKVFGHLERRVSSFSGGSLNLGSLAFVALAGFGIYQISRGNLAAPAWYTAFWYAMNIFLKSDDGSE